MIRHSGNKESATDALLSLKHISVEFDGFKAVNDVTTSIAPHEIHFFIGPNGAGKTTLLDVICGKTKPSAGEVDYAGVGNILKLKEFEIVKKGICRKFQVPSTFVNLSVYDNMRIALNHDKSVFGSLFMRKRYLDTRKIYEVLNLVGLDKKSKERAKSLSHGEKQWLEIAMLLVEETEALAARRAGRRYGTGRNGEDSTHSRGNQGPLCCGRRRTRYELRQEHRGRCDGHA